VSGDYTVEEVVSAFAEQGLAVEVIGSGPEATFILPSGNEPRSWRVTVFSSQSAAEQFLSRFPVHPDHMTRNRNVVAISGSSGRPVAATVLTALDSLEQASPPAFAGERCA
jgi:hypothetical protein